MGARKLYEEKILSLIKDIPEDELAHVVAMIENRSKQLSAIRDVCGKYADVNTTSEEFSKRKREEKLLDK